MQKRLLVPLGILLLLAALFFGVLKFRDIFTEKPETQNNNQNQSPDENKDEPPVQEPGFDKTKYALDDPASIWLVVNKARPLNPKSYVPDNLVFPDVRLRVPGNESMKIRADVGEAVEQLFSGAKAVGYSPMFSSGYRSYNYQVSLYGGYVKSQGQTEADKQSARPGYSEHQTGLAFDICDASDCDLVQSFGDTLLGQWVAAHAHEYGFTIRYKKDMQGTTGYIYEPWHLRYVGVELATELHKTGQTMEEFFGLPAAPDYL